MNSIPAVSPAPLAAPGTPLHTLLMLHQGNAASDARVRQLCANIGAEMEEAANTLPALVAERDALRAALAEARAVLRDTQTIADNALEGRISPEQALGYLKTYAALTTDEARALLARAQGGEEGRAQ